MPSTADSAPSPPNPELRHAAGGTREVPGSSGTTVVELSGVEVVVNRTRILRAIDLTITSGEVIGIVGANGSGKTTLLRVLAGLLPPSAGTVRVAPVTESPGSPSIELLGHQPALYPELTLRENLEFVTRLAGRPTTHASRHLDTVGLARAADRRADRASHGMQRRLEFARALMRQPDLLLLDEAHAGLDANAQALVGHVVAGVTARRGAVVMVSHEADRFAGIAQRLLRIVDGTLVAESPS